MGIQTWTAAAHINLDNVYMLAAVLLHPRPHRTAAKRHPHPHHRTPKQPTHTRNLQQPSQRTSERTHMNRLYAALALLPLARCYRCSHHPQRVTAPQRRLSGLMNPPLSQP